MSCEVVDVAVLGDAGGWIDFGIVTMPFWRIQRIETCAGVLRWRLAISISSGMRFDAAPHDRRPRLQGYPAIAEQAA